MKVQSRNNSFATLLATKRLPHAVLLTGITLANQCSAAQQLAQQLLCNNHTGCGECSPCQWVAKRSHPDLLWLPAEDTETIKIDDIRQVIHHLSQSAHQGKYKIVILAPAEAMPPAAMNALLKILEEPPAKSLLLLLSQYPSLLPATLRSRCQRVVLTADQASDTPDVTALWETLLAVHRKQLTPLQAAAQWQKESLLSLVETFYYCAVKYVLGSSKLNKAVFIWFDQINSLRSQLLRKLNPNHLLALEMLFYQWSRLHDVG